MNIVHLLYPNESGCVYCKKINGLIRIIPMKTPCLSCEKVVGSIQGEGIGCEWDDFDFSEQGIAVYDPIAEYDRINKYGVIPTKKRLIEWKLRNKVAGVRYQKKLAGQYTTQQFSADSHQRKKLIEEVEEYCGMFRDYGIEPPNGFPHVSDEEMEDWLSTWSEFNPYPEDD